MKRVSETRFGSVFRKYILELTGSSVCEICTDGIFYRKLRPENSVYLFGGGTGLCFSAFSAILFLFQSIISGVKRNRDLRRNIVKTTKGLDSYAV